MEPYKLRRWKRSSSGEPLALFTCARPGRSKGTAGAVPDEVVDKWVEGLPGAPPIVLLSLLGRKPDGLSEYSFYTFAGAFEASAERKNRPLFATWLDKRHPGRVEAVIEHPTIDFKAVDAATLAAVAANIDAQLSLNRTVVLFDSGGETRTRQVCSYGEFVEDPRM